MFKAASSPEQEPDFYTMPPVLVSPHGSEGEYCDSNSSIDPVYEDGYETTLASGIVNPIQLVPIPFSEPSNSNSYCRMQSQAASVVIPQSRFCNRMPNPADADRVLDQAVDELFLQQGEIDNLDEFIHDWDPSFEHNLDEAIDDDSQLGYLLEKLLG
jgi:hypothetical protein